MQENAVFWCVALFGEMGIQNIWNPLGFHTFSPRGSRGPPFHQKSTGFNILVILGGFHEITPNSLKEAILKPRTINMNLVQAQQARQVLDRVVGFKLSPLLWKSFKSVKMAPQVWKISKNGI